MLRTLAFFLPLLLLTAVGVGPTAGQAKKEPAGDRKAGDEKLELTPVEKAILDLTNKERAKAKLPPLKPSPLLFKAARGHSANMANKNQMNHFLDGKGPVERVQAVGYVFKHVGENVGESDGFPPPVIVQGWMNSKIHRDNILKPQYTEIGLGAVRGTRGWTYYTQLFGTPRQQANTPPAKEGNSTR